MPAIVLQKVEKVFAGHAPAVRELDLTIPDASFTTLLGPSGCGKTTTLRMIAGLEMPSSGDISIGDQLVFSASKGRSVASSKRGLGLVFQSYALWPHLTVRQNIAFGLEVRRVGRAELKERVERVAAALQIEPYLARYTSELSGGQQQRVAIARVLVMRPKVLLLDEPLSNLDAKLRMDMRAELKRLHAETGATVVYVTHDQLEALTMSTHIAMMRDGVLQQVAPPLELYAQPANQFAADFLGNPRINLIAGATGQGGVDCDGLLVPLDAPLAVPSGTPVTVGLRAEELRIEREPGPGRAPAVVRSVLPTGADWYFRLELTSPDQGRAAADGGAAAEAALMVRDNRLVDLSEGERVYIEAAPSPAKVFDRDGRSLTSPAGPSAPAEAPAAATVVSAGAMV